MLARFQQTRDKEYQDGLTHAEHLELLGPVFDSDVANATLTIDISPNGNDTWRFDWELEGTWSDGAPFADGQADLALDQDSRHFEKLLSI